MITSLNEDFCALSLSSYLLLAHITWVLRYTLLSLPDVHGEVILVVSFCLLTFIHNNHVPEYSLAQAEQNISQESKQALHSVLTQGHVSSASSCFQEIRGQIVPLQKTWLAGTCVQETKGSIYYYKTKPWFSLLYFFSYGEIWGLEWEQPLNRLHLTFVGQAKSYAVAENYLEVLLRLLRCSQVISNLDLWEVWSPGTKCTV